jgi:hypothetical protein
MGAAMSAMPDTMAAANTRFPAIGEAAATADAVRAQYLTVVSM